jgi:hypothetical protein
VLTVKTPCSRRKFIIMGTAVKTPIWNRNWVLRAVCSAALLRTLPAVSNDASTPDNACFSITESVSYHATNKVLR